MTPTKKTILKHDTRYFRGCHVFEQRNFKIGDLVVNKLPIELTFDDYVVCKGSIGLVIRLIDHKDWSVGEYDYLVLIQGREVYFFDYELNLYKNNESAS